MLPSKLRSGQKFMTAVPSKINQIIDYLKTQRLVSDNKTIRVNQLTSGVALSAMINPPGSPGGTPSNFDHPFKMSIGVDETTEQQVLRIKRGRIALNGDDQSRIYVCFQPNEDGFDEYVPLPDEEGTFQVCLLIFYDENTQSPNQDFWEIRIVYVQTGSNTHNWVNSCGMFQIYLGNIEVTENEDNELSYRITKQNITSGFSVYDGFIQTHFKAWFKCDTYPDNGDILDDDLLPDYIIINAGNVMLNGRYLNSTQSWFQLPQSLENVDRIYCVQVNTVANLVGFRVFSSNEIVFTEDNITYNIPICRLVTDGASAVGVQQFIIGDFCFALDDKKVLLNSTDQIPGFLEDKIKIPTTDFTSLDGQQQSFYSAYPNNSYIKAIRFSDSSNFSMNSMSSSELSTYWDQVYWNYKGIPNWSGDSSSSSNFQTIMNDNNSLKWFEYGKIRVNQSDTSPDYLDTKFVPGQFIFKAVSEDFKLKVWTRGIKQGYNQRMTEGKLDDDDQKPYTQIDGYKTTLTALHGLKCSDTKTNENFTIQYTVEIDYPNFALEIDNSIASLLDIEKSAGGIKIKSALQGSGLMAVSGGNISIIPAPSSGNVVLGCSNGSFSWIPYADCDTACSSASAN